MTPEQLAWHLFKETGDVKQALACCYRATLMDSMYITYLAKQSKLQAIKHVHDMTGAMLRDCKTYVEAL